MVGPEGKLLGSLAKGDLLLTLVEKRKSGAGGTKPPFPVAAGAFMAG